ncbi:thioredoxin domain-containing protein [Xenococcus sp. PCC 7305]|uniref:thioredoxin family protein n=1 Tax=Xenococcus sp. PCC 7305 TaxID=102125 RepID=UPI0002ABB0B4|nr:thioredoxin family protein [Xenococcus sp. PCC 7305]ELS03791.1 thioredoxin domain-containing protein [Xenococcus sp. PCC 7305]
MSFSKSDSIFRVVSEKTFNQEVLSSAEPILVHFSAPWCGLCRMINPMLNQLQTKQKRPIKIVMINADENFRLANAYRLKNLPTLLLFENGRLAERLDDFNSREGIVATLEKIMLPSTVC